MSSPGAGEARSRNCSMELSGSVIPPGKVGHHRKRVLRSRPKGAARSVDSQCRSRVIEPRNKNVVGAFVVRNAGAAPNRQKGQARKSDRGLRAGQRHKGVPWEHGRPDRVLGTNTGKDAPVEQHPGPVADGGPVAGSESAPPTQGIRRNVTNGVTGEARGSLSGLVVLPESRRTGPPGAGE